MGTASTPPDQNQNQQSNGLRNSPPPTEPTFKPRRRNPPSKRRRTRQSDDAEPPSTSLAVAPNPQSAHVPTSQPLHAISARKPSRWDARPPPSSLPSPSPKPKTKPKPKPPTQARAPTNATAPNSTRTNSTTAKTTGSQLGEDAVDRAWYLGKDGDGAEREAPVMDDALIARRQSRNLSAKAAANMHDTARWESTQLSSGLHAVSQGGSRESVPQAGDDSAPRITLLVSELTPNFLCGPHAGAPAVRSAVGHKAVIGDRVVWPVKDITSDMAKVARNGSQTVQTFRESKERGKPRVKYWDLGMKAGAKALESSQADADRSAKELSARAGNADWKSEMQYASSLGKMHESKEVSRDTGLPADGRRSITKVRRSLPVYSVKRSLMNVIRENQVCIVVGETGSGKTTQLSQYLEEEGYAQYGVIGCTQPRRVAAVSVAQRVSLEFRGGCQLGEEVGYTIRFEDCSSEKTVIKYMTDGILLRESLGDSDLDRYSVIIMDEAHERSLNTDVLFGILRGIVLKRRDLKVIITSATLNADKFAEFFGGAPIFNIPGRTFPVDSFFSRNPVEDYVHGAVWQALQIHIQAPLPGDVLVFMTGQEDIEATCETLAEEIRKRENPRPILILPIYSQLAADLQAKIFEPAPEGTRKVVVATNIAETSLTINGIKFVIDSGFCKLKTYNPRLGMDALLLCPASQSAVTQRSGRAGRTGPGKCYRLFTSAAYVSELLETNVPEIQRTNLSHVVLLLKTLGVRDILEFPFLDPPPAEIILKSMHGLWLLGAMDNEGMLTDLGRRMSVFPLDPALSALVFMGEQMGCLIESVTIVAMLSVPNAFVRPTGREEDSDNAREKFFVPESDHLTLLHVYQRWRAAGCRPDWCTRNFVNNKSLKKAREVREQLLEIARTQGMAESSCDEWDSVRKAIGRAYFYQAARRKGIGEYINIRSGVVCVLHPTSAMFGSGLTPDYVVYHELIMTKKEYMSCITAVEPQWLAESGPMLYVLKQAGDEGLELAHDLKERRAKIESELQSKG